MTVKVTLLPATTVELWPLASVFFRARSKTGTVQLGEVTVAVEVQPFRLAVRVMLVPTGILLMVLPLTIPAVEVIVPLVVTFTL
ncbi:hypothetical protein GCM10028808_27230 [Spirosoma migulaei]